MLEAAQKLQQLEGSVLAGRVADSPHGQACTSQLPVAACWQVGEHCQQVHRAPNQSPSKACTPPLETAFPDGCQGIWQLRC